MRCPWTKARTNFKVHFDHDGETVEHNLAPAVYCADPETNQAKGTWMLLEESALGDDVAALAASGVLRAPVMPKTQGRKINSRMAQPSGPTSKPSKKPRAPAS